jgi:hypothetical protein
VGAHILMIDIEDIYFLTGLSRRGSRVTLTGSRGGAAYEPLYQCTLCARHSEA